MISPQNTPIFQYSTCFSQRTCFSVILITSGCLLGVPQLPSEWLCWYMNKARLMLWVLPALVYLSILCAQAKEVKWVTQYYNNFNKVSTEISQQNLSSISEGEREKPLNGNNSQVETDAAILSSLPSSPVQPKSKHRSHQINFKPLSISVIFGLLCRNRLNQDNLNGVLTEQFKSFLGPPRPPPGRMVFSSQQNLPWKIFILKFLGGLFVKTNENWHCFLQPLPPPPTNSI